MKAFFKNLFAKIGGKKKPMQRGYRDVVGMTGPYLDWALNFLSEDGDLWQNNAVLRDRARDLFKTDCYFRKYQMELEANVFGESGLRLRMKIMETEDRVVYAPDEKSFLEAHTRKMERLFDRIAKRTGNDELRREMTRLKYDRAKASVQTGELDLYACRIIENAWKEWQRKEFATVSGRLTYNEVRRLRLIAAARDGEIFIRLVRDAKINKFGFSLQLINAEWCDFNLNVSKLDNGNSIRMGIEINEWGKPVAYHFIKQSPWAWQWSQPGYTLAASVNGHERIPAEEIVHYARFDYGDSTRGATWAASVIQKSRQLDKFEEAEVIAARVAACKMGFLQSSVDPQGGQMEAPETCEKPDGWDMSPGSIQGLRWGQEFKEWNPQHPTQNFESFRKGMLRSWCAGLPGADYNVIANDLENINFSAGRLGRLDTNEMWKLLQRFDIETGERPIFEAWLEMVLITGAVPLPYAKINKFNKPHFSGRRWAGVDPVKEAQAYVLALKNKLTSYSQVYDEMGLDLEETWLEIAEEQMLAEELGIKLPADEEEAPDEDPEEPSDDGQGVNGAAKHHNGRQLSVTV